MKNKVSIAKLKKIILKNIENKESSSTQYLVSTFKLWTQFASTQHKKSNFDKLYKIHQDTLTLLIDEGFITNPSNKSLSDTEVKLSPEGRQHLNKPILEINIKDLLQNPWIITIVGGVVVILVGAYMFGIGKPDNLHITDEKEVAVKTQNPNSVSIGINYLTLKETIGEPVFINKSEEFSEYIYADNEQKTQIITNKENIIVAFSITKTSGSLQLNLYSFNVNLGTDYIYREKTQPLRCFGFIGANGPAYYFEEYYLGRPGNYLYFYVGSVEVLPVIMGISPMKTYTSTTQTRYKPLVEYNCSDIPNSDRKNYVVKTVMYSSMPLQDLPFLPGPNTDQLNLINN